MLHRFTTPNICPQKGSLSTLQILGNFPLFEKMVVVNFTTRLKKGFYTERCGLLLCVFFYNAMQFFIFLGVTLKEVLFSLFFQKSQSELSIEFVFKFGLISRKKHFFSQHHKSSIDTINPNFFSVYLLFFSYKKGKIVKDKCIQSKKVS